jgi:hypothetical protein
MKRPSILAVAFLAFACGAPVQKKAKPAPEAVVLPSVVRKTPPIPVAKGTSKDEVPEPATFIASANHLDKAWRLKVKSATAGDNDVTITLEFTNDVDEKHIKAMRSAFDYVVRVYFLDKDNVSMLSDDVAGGVAISRMEGEPTGKANDAFRVIAPCENQVLKMVKKVEVRPLKMPRP